MLDLSAVNKEWTLFLDRDGVINDDKSPYTLNADQFDFYDGVPESISELGDLFGRVIIITNQRGVGRNLMTLDDLEGIHQKLVAGVQKAGGRIDGIYYCTATDDDHPDRKPNPGMALKAMRDHSDISPEKSIMVGNNMSDMQFGRNAGFYTVLVQTTGTTVNLPHLHVDMQFKNLPEFSSRLLNSIR